VINQKCTAMQGLIVGAGIEIWKNRGSVEDWIKFFLKKPLIFLFFTENRFCKLESRQFKKIRRI
jgi:hypothetical protein